MTTTALIETLDGVALVTLNRPDRLNALNGELQADFLAAIQAVAADDAVAAVVVTGAGRGFCAGGDTKDAGQKRAEGVPPPLELTRGAGLRRSAEASRLLREMPKPTIAMVNGPVAGAGIGIAGACDLRFAAELASFLSAYRADRRGRRLWRDLRLAEDPRRGQGARAVPAGREVHRPGSPGLRPLHPGVPRRRAAREDLRGRPPLGQRAALGLGLYEGQPQRLRGRGLRPHLDGANP